MSKIFSLTENKIKTPKHFFSAKGIAYLDAFDVTESTMNKSGYNFIRYKSRVYLKIMLTGEPQNLILNMPRVVKNGHFSMIIWFSPSDLDVVISQGKIFDISNVYRNKKYGKQTKDGFFYNATIPDSFFIENYIDPYISPDNGK